MKKIFIALALVLMLSSSAYSDGEPAHIVLGNVMNISGGNDSVYIQTDDYSPENRTAASSITVLDSIWSSRPVMFGSIPSERNALMNSGEPVDIIARGDRLKIINWGGDGVYSVRVLDSNGNAIMKDTLRTRQNSNIEIALTPEYRHYYLEFTETNAYYDSENGYFPEADNSSRNEIRYCYVHLKMKGTKEEPKRESEPVRPETRDSNSASDAISDIYRQLRNMAVNDSVIHFEDNTQKDTISRDEVFRPRETYTHEENHEENHNVNEENHEEENEDDDTNLIPARRIRIKHNTEYESDSESEPETDPE